jgi:hypothetical protein
MNVGMTIGAATIEVLNGTQWLGLCRMPAAVVTGIAYTRHPQLQELRIIAAMRFVAVRAVFHHGRVFPKEWATALGVAGEAVLVYRALNQLAGIGRAMWVVATGACDLAFPIRHM